MTRQGRGSCGLYCGKSQTYRKEEAVAGAVEAAPLLWSPASVDLPALPSGERRTEVPGEGPSPRSRAEAPAPLLGTVTLGASFHFAGLNFPFWDSA